MWRFANFCYGLCDQSCSCFPGVCTRNQTHTTETGQPTDTSTHHTPHITHLTQASHPSRHHPRNNQPQARTGARVLPSRSAALTRRADKLASLLVHPPPSETPRAAVAARASPHPDKGSALTASGRRLFTDALPVGPKTTTSAASAPRNESRAGSIGRTSADQSPPFFC